jgi:Ca2+-binding RTX toxin-like protein
MQRRWSISAPATTPLPSRARQRRSTPEPGSKGNDSIALKHGSFSLHLGSGDDKIGGSAGVGATITAGGGTDSVNVVFGNYSVHLGGGADTIGIREGAGTVVAGNGNDSVTFADGHFSVHLGSGNDTISAFDAHLNVDTVTTLSLAERDVFAGVSPSSARECL